MFIQRASEAERASERFAETSSEQLHPAPKGQSLKYTKKDSSLIDLFVAVAMNLLRFYGERVARAPLATESLQTSFLFTLGDIIAQRFIERNESHDLIRTGRFVLFGGVVAGPLLSTWYGFLHRRVVLRNPFLGLCARVALDQLCFTPVFISTFFLGMGTLEGKDLNGLRSKLSESFATTLVANWKLWVPFQFVNFYITPPQYRLLAVNVTATGWNSFLSYTNSRANARVEKEKIEKLEKDG